MKFVALVLLSTVAVQAQETKVTGKITYLSGETIYTSLGTAEGVQDSTILVVLAGVDTLAWLKVFAVSSKSSACSILRTVKPLSVGANVTGMIPRPEESAQVSKAEPTDSTFNEANVRSALPIALSPAKKEHPFVTMQGRVSLQYYTAIFDNNSFNFSQPGLVLNLHAASTDAPIALDIYGNVRRLARAGENPFNGNATDASRIYRFSLTYDDHENEITIGRIIPSYAPSIGSIDGVSLSHRFGAVVSGVSLGFQPPYALQGPSEDTRKFAVYAQYQTHGPLDLSVTAAYARTYNLSILDREAASFVVNGYSTGGFSIYGYADVDLRSKQGGQFVLSPGLSLASATISYRVLDFLTVGVGADASRPFFPFSSVRDVADSLLDHTLRSGATMTLTFNLPNGVGAYNTYSPRSTDAGFGQEFMNSTTFYITDALSTGATVRASYMMNENEFTSSRGYGASLERSVFGIDFTVRYQENRYRIVQLNQDYIGQTLGGDLMAPFSRHLSFVTSVDRTKGFGVNSYTVFSELSWRF